MVRQGQVDRFEVDDSEAIARALDGDESGFKRLFERHFPRVVAACRGYPALDGGDAQDAAQDAFVRGFAALASLREPAHFGRWVLAIAHNRCRTLSSRGRRRAVAMGMYVEEVSLVASMPSTRERELVQLVLETVEDPKARQVATMYYVEGYTSGEISKKLEIPVSTVTTWMSRLMARVRARLLADALDPYGADAEESPGGRSKKGGER